MIQPLVLAERRKRFEGKPYSPVIILTGTELFPVRGIYDYWKGKGGLYDQLSDRSFELSELPNLADATQRLYLNLPGWYEWSEAKWSKQKQKRGQS